MQYVTEIFSNGSKCAGEKPDSLDVLAQRLEDHPLERSFMNFGGFIWQEYGAWWMFGNFLTYSHVFNIRTTDPKIASRFRRLIMRNQKRADYLEQPHPMPSRYRIADKWHGEGHKISDRRAA